MNENLSKISWLSMSILLSSILSACNSGVESNSTIPSSNSQVYQEHVQTYTLPLKNSLHVKINDDEKINFVNISSSSSAKTNCGLNDHGHAYCWGNGITGQIGNDASKSVDLATPVAMPDGVKVVSIFVNKEYNCALSNHGKAWCWGTGSNGKLGNDSPINYVSNTPQAVAMPANSQIVTMASSDEFSCVIDQDGDAYCWGNGKSGTLGNGDEKMKASAKPVPVVMPDGVKFTALFGDKNSICALGNDGDAYCWGQGYPNHVPQKMAVADVKFSKIAVQSSFACALSEDGDAYCWGSNANGEIGNGSHHSDWALEPSLVTMPKGAFFTSIATSLNSSCAISDSGQAYCWGKGGIGNADVNSSNIPLLVTMPHGVKFVSISSNSNLSSFCAIADSGKTYCWGDNTLGQNGNGKPEHYNKIPTEVVTPEGVSFKQIISSELGKCGLDQSGQAYCWGNGSLGQIGNGEYENKLIPTMVKVNR